MTASRLPRSSDHLSQQVMGILNVTPDSFSDGEQFFGYADAVERGRRLFAEGAAMVDVGGESTRPGAERVSAEQQIERIVAVIAALESDGPISVDTTDSRVAEEAVSAGAVMINDVSASLEQTAARLGVSWVAMHMRGEPATMQQAPKYTDVVAEVTDDLRSALARATAAGVVETWVDPGIGFGKSAGHNLELLKNLRQIGDLGAPLLVGVSRKATMAALTMLSDSGRGRRPLERVPATVVGRASAAVGMMDRLEMSAAFAVWSWSQGARMVRVHDVAATIAARDAWRCAAA